MSPPIPNVEMWSSYQSRLTGINTCIMTCVSNRGLEPDIASRHFTNCGCAFLYSPYAGCHTLLSNVRINGPKLFVPTNDRCTCFSILLLSTSRVNGQVFLFNHVCAAPSLVNLVSLLFMSPTCAQHQMGSFVGHSSDPNLHCYVTGLVTSRGHRRCGRRQPGIRDHVSRLLFDCYHSFFKWQANKYLLGSTICQFLLDSLYCYLFSQGECKWWRIN